MDTLKLVMRPYVTAALKDKLGDITDKDYVEYTKLHGDFGINTNTGIFYPRLIEAMESAGFNILKDGGELSNVITEREERHRTVVTDDGVISVPEYINMLFLQHG